LSRASLLLHPARLARELMPCVNRACPPRP